MAQLFRYDNAFGFGCQMVQHSDNARFLIMPCFVATGALSSRRKHGFRGGVVRLLGVELRLPVLSISESRIQLSRQLGCP